MSKKGIQVKRTTMKEGGYYSLSTAGAKDVIDGASNLVIQALEAIKVTDQHKIRFTVMDMGCADGGTSLTLMHKIIQFLLQQTPHRPIQLVYEDQPQNDYNALFENVRTTKIEGNSLTTLANVFLSAAPISFYERVLPANSVIYIFCATAMHWLRHKPCEISNHVQAVGAKGKELQAFKQQGQKDWEHILICRAQELVKQGKMVIINFCRDETGQYLGNTEGVNIFTVFSRSANFPIVIVNRGIFIKYSFHN